MVVIVASMAMTCMATPLDLGGHPGGLEDSWRLHATTDVIVNVVEAGLPGGIVVSSSMCQ